MDTQRAAGVTGIAIALAAVVVLILPWSPAGAWLPVTVAGIGVAVAVYALLLEPAPPDGEPAGRRPR